MRIIKTSNIPYHRILPVAEKKLNALNLLFSPAFLYKLMKYKRTALCETALPTIWFSSL